MKTPAAFLFAENASTGPDQALSWSVLPTAKIMICVILGLKKFLIYVRFVVVKFMICVEAVYEA